MTRYWRVYFWTALAIIVLNCWGMVKPLGVEGTPIQTLGFPRAFLWQTIMGTSFSVIRLLTDVTFALIVCHGVSKWAERREEW